MWSHQRGYINKEKIKKAPHEEIINTQLASIQKKCSTFGKQRPFQQQDTHISICENMPLHSHIFRSEKMKYFL